MLFIGLTGNIAAGKSEVAKRLAELGATILDADVLAREAVQPGTPALARIVAKWGNAVISPDGTLDRKALRHLVFADAEQLEALNAIVHPAVIRLRRRRVAEARERGVRVLVYVVPLLFERHLADEFDRVILVDAPKEVRMRRLTHQRRVSAEDATNMVASQMPAELKRARADFVIENEGDIRDLRRSVDAVWERLTAHIEGSSLAV